MAQHFELELSMREDPAEAQARAASALEDPAKAVGLRLTKRGAAELGYKTSVKFPFLLRLYHNLNGERMTVTFQAGPDGGTRVTLTGAVARANHALASDPEHWSDALGGTPGA
jgi:hypothetical protein